MIDLFHSQQMVKVGCLIHKEYAERTIFALGELEIVHLTQLKFVAPTKYEVSEGGRGRLQEVSSLLSRTSSVLAKLGLKHRISKRIRIEWEDTSALIEEATADLEAIEKRIEEIDAATQALEADLTIPIPRFRLRKKGLEMRLHELAKESGKTLHRLSLRLTGKRLVYEVLDRLPHTKKVYFFEGWVPKRRLKEFYDCLQSVSEGFGGVLREVEAEISPEKAARGLGKPPRLLRYPRVTGVFGSFASITRAFGVPDYYEFDPTAFFLLSFPIIFGMMYGDIGHGVMLFAGAWIIYLLKDRFVFGKASIFRFVFEGLPLIMLCATSSIIFGFLYGELFGSEEWFTLLTGLHEALWFSPLRHPNALLRYSLYVGIIHFSFGLILDMLNKVSSRQFVEALLGPSLWLWFYLSGSYLVVTRGWGVVDVMNEPVTPGLFILLPFGFMLLGSMYLEGYMGVNKALEALLTSFSHTVSYARILALKVISTSFSILILPTSVLGFIPFFIGTLFLITIFENLLVFLHTLRLHWIEWFSKFYRGSGEQFRPFALVE
ncbi:MAG: V-type ATPase 116kDa subunit family protein [Nitrososphaerales archaeon]